MKTFDSGRIHSSRSVGGGRPHPHAQRCLQRGQRPCCQPCEKWNLDDGDDADGPSTSTSTRPHPRVLMPEVRSTPTLQAAPQRPTRTAFSTTLGGDRTSKLEDSSSTAPEAALLEQLRNGHPPSSAAPGPSSQPVSNESLTLEAEVKATLSSQQLQEVLQRRGIQSLSPQELILFCNQLSKVQKASAMTVRSLTQTQAMLQQLLQAVDVHLDQLNTYELIVLLAATARLRHSPSEEWLSHFFTLCEPRLRECGTGNLTMLVRAVSCLGLDPWVIKEVASFRPWREAFLSATLKKMHAFRSDQLICVISSLADLLEKPHAEWMDEFNSALRMKLPTMESPLLAKGMLAFSALQYEPQRPLLKAYYMQLYSKLPMFDDQDLATTAQAFVVLKRLIKHDFLCEFLDEVGLKLHTFTPITLANLLVALASIARPHHLQYNLALAPRFAMPDKLLRAIGERVQQGMWSFSGDCLANSLWGLALLGYKRSPALAEKCVAASHSKLHTMRNEELTRMLMVLGMFKYQPRDERARATLDAWFLEFTKLAGRREYSMRQAGDMLSTLAAMPDAPQRHVSHGFIAQVLASTRPSDVQRISAARVAGLARSLQVLRHKPDFGFLHSLVQLSRFFWTSFRPQEYADLISALADMGCPEAVDPLWVTEFLAIIQCRLDQFPPQALSKLLVATAELPGVKPGAYWMRLAVARVHNTIGSYSALQLSNVVIALGRRRHRPPAPVFDSFVQHIAAHAAELPPRCAAEVSRALRLIAQPAELQSDAGAEQYARLQARLSTAESPAPAPAPAPGPGSIVLQPVHLTAVDMDRLPVQATSSAPPSDEHHFRNSCSSIAAVDEKQLVSTEGR